MIASFIKHQSANQSSLGRNSDQIIYWSALIQNSRWFLVIAFLASIIGIFQTGVGRLPDPVPVTDGTASSTIEMKTPEIKGKTIDGRSFTIQAERGFMEYNDDRKINLININALTELQNNKRLQVSSQTGRLSSSDERLWLRGEVVARHSDGTILETEIAEVWKGPDGLQAQSRTTTRIKGHDRSTESRGFITKEGLKTMHLYGPISVRGEQP
jgi:hypothetical protein